MKSSPQATRSQIAVAVAVLMLFVAYLSQYRDEPLWGSVVLLLVLIIMIPVIIVLALLVMRERRVKRGGSVPPSNGGLARVLSILAAISWCMSVLAFQRARTASFTATASQGGYLQNAQQARSILVGSALLVLILGVVQGFAFLPLRKLGKQSSASIKQLLMARRRTFEVSHACLIIFLVILALFGDVSKGQESALYFVQALLLAAIGLPFVLGAWQDEA